MQKTITKTIILLVVLTLALGVNYLFAAWTGPTQAPTGGNTSTPVHVGTTDQVKNGGLSVDALSVFGSQYLQGTIQIGNSSVVPQEGTVRFTGSDLEVYMGGAWVSLTGAALACTSFTYSDWGECQSNSTQTRTVLTSSPDGCTGGNPATTQSCTYTLPMSTQCQNVGGSWVSSQGTCYVPGTSCPSGWSPNSSYSSTRANSCSGIVTDGHGGCSPDSCSTGSHVRTNTGVESCGYVSVVTYWSRGGCRATSGGTCSATKTEIGCTKN